MRRKFEIISTGLFVSGLILIVVAVYSHSIPMCTTCEGYFEHPESATLGSMMGAYLFSSAIIGIPTWTLYQLFLYFRNKREKNQ